MEAEEFTGVNFITFDNVGKFNAGGLMVGKFNANEWRDIVEKKVDCILHEQEQRQQNKGSSYSPLLRIHEATTR